MQPGFGRSSHIHGEFGRKILASIVWTRVGWPVWMGFWLTLPRTTSPPYVSGCYRRRGAENEQQKHGKGMAIA